MSTYRPSCPPSESLRLEAVTTCVGFDDILDVTLGNNHPHFDTMIVVTSHDDRKTHLVCQKHGVVCVQTDLFQKNGRRFNKGAALNAGMSRWQYHGWRQTMDADILLPDNYRRLLLNHTHLDENAIYGADRFDVIGLEEWESIKRGGPQHSHGAFAASRGGHHSPRYVDPLYGAMPLGYLQLYHASCEKPHPFSLGDASHDDILRAAQWPASHRRLLPTVMVYHLVARPPVLGENWNGDRQQPRLDS